MSLIVKNLKKSYGDKVVVDDLSFQMQGPGVYALLGTNGAGKTTTIRMMLNMLARDGGEVLWNGDPLTTDNCNVGYLAEERGLYPKYSLMDQLMYFASLRGVPKAEAKERIKYWAHRLEAEEYLYPKAEKAPALGEGKKVRAVKKKKAFKPKLADQLSKGNQQKIQFMIALISDPELIILDEPLSGLDPVNTDLFKGIIREQIAAGKYLIMSSHQMATVIAAPFGSGPALFMSLCPFISAFAAPAYYITGDIGIGIVIASWLIQFICIFLIYKASGKIYDRLIMYKGSRMKMTRILGMAMHGKEGK